MVEALKIVLGTLVATDLILHELTSEIPSRVIIPACWGWSNCCCMAGVAREGVATPARS
jgi:hypothetical protein